MKGKKPFAIVLFTLAACLAVALLLRHFHEDRAEDDLVTCTVHIYQYRLMLEEYRSKEAALPVASDALSVARMMMARMNHVGSSWSRDLEVSCPEAFRESKGVGYVYVGSGLPSKLLDSDHPPLILFCSVSNHKIRQTWNVLLGIDRYAVHGAKKMRALLEGAIEAGESGRISYDAAAMEALKRELQSLR